MSYIDQEIDTAGIIIHGKQGHGKTSLAVFLAIENWEKRIYANISIKKNGDPIGKKLESIDEVNNIRFSYTPGVIIIDEAGLNYSSRSALTEKNAVFTKLLFLIRKKNCSLIFIAQRFESIDINARALAEVIFNTRKIRRGKNHPLFKITTQKMKNGKPIYKSGHVFDTISALKFLKIEYDQLEASDISKPLK